MLYSAPLLTTNIRGTYVPPVPVGIIDSNGKPVIDPLDPAQTGILPGENVPAYESPETAAGTATAATGTVNFLKEYGVYIAIGLLIVYSLKR